jgi:hypothetical protein
MAKVLSQESKQDLPATVENVLINGDLSKLNPAERVSYYKAVCDSVGLNSLTRPFEYITLNGRLTLYARKDATDQLRSIHGVSIKIVGREVVQDCYVVTAQATMPSGRTDESIGAVPATAKGDALANSLMKSETKAKRRVTLSICGLGMLDETEIETVPNAVIGEPSQKPPEITSFLKPEIGSGAPPQAASEDIGEGKTDNPPAANSQLDALADKLANAQGTPPKEKVQYITAGQATNLHKEFRKTMKDFNAAQYLRADEHFYQALLSMGFYEANTAADGTEEKIPSSSLIPAAQWFPIKRQMLDYARSAK